MSRFPFGKDAVAYFATEPLSDSVDAASASWAEYDNVRDVTGNFSETTVDATTRAVAKLGWEAEDVVLTKGEITMNIPQQHADVTDTVLAALIAAWLGKTTVTAMVLTGPNDGVGNQGLAANFSVSMKHNQPLKDVQSWDVTLRISSFPEWRVVA